MTTQYTTTVGIRCLSCSHPIQPSEYTRMIRLRRLDGTQMAFHPSCWLRYRAAHALS